MSTELLLGTLRTHQKAACDEEMVTLICPRGTTISIQVAQYGASVTQGSCASELAEYQPVAVEVVGDTSCAWPSALQVRSILPTFDNYFCLIFQFAISGRVQVGWWG